MFNDKAQRRVIRVDNEALKVVEDNNLMGQTFEINERQCT